MKYIITFIILLAFSSNLAYAGVKIGYFNPASENITIENVSTSTVTIPTFQLASTVQITETLENNKATMLFLTVPQFASSSCFVATTTPWGKVYRIRHFFSGCIK